MMRDQQSLRDDFDRLNDQLSEFRIRFQKSLSDKRPRLLALPQPKSVKTRRGKRKGTKRGHSSFSSTTSSSSYAGLDKQLQSISAATQALDESASQISRTLDANAKEQYDNSKHVESYHDSVEELFSESSDDELTKPFEAYKKLKHDYQRVFGPLEEDQ